MGLWVLIWRLGALQPLRQQRQRPEAERAQRVGGGSEQAEAGDVAGAAREHVTAGGRPSLTHANLGPWAQRKLETGGRALTIER